MITIIKELHLGRKLDFSIFVNVQAVILELIFYLNIHILKYL